MWVLRGRFGSRDFGLLATGLLSCGAFAALVGSRVLIHPGRGVVGFNPSSDYQIMTWSLRWWPWALTHGLNGLHTGLLWAPGGFSTLWITSIPGPALLGLPITLIAGPLAAYNFLMFAAFVLAALAMFLLSYELTESAPASIAAGLVFGLSPYMLGHTLSEHLDLTMVFPLPLLALVVVRFARGRTSGFRPVAAFAGLLLLLTGSAFELTVDLTVLIVVVALATIATPDHLRPVVRRGLALVAAGYAICLPVLIPIAVLALSTAHGAVPHPQSAYAVDLANIVLPTPTLLAGRLHAVQAVTRHFVGNIGERDGYIGLPLLVISALAVRSEWRRGAWLVGTAVAIGLVLSLGPVIALGGRPLIRLPFSLGRLPILDSALPARLSLFVAFGVAILCALWLAKPRSSLVTIAVGALVVVSLFPDVAAPEHLARAWGSTARFAWSTERAPVNFLADRRWSTSVPAGANVLVLPTEDRTAAEYWQAFSGMQFRLAVPETPFAPPALATDPTVAGLVNNVLPQRDGLAIGGARLRAFLIDERVGAVVMTRRAAPRWGRLVQRAVGGRPVAVDGLRVFRVARSLRPAQAVGEYFSARLGRRSDPRLRAWLHFDGRRAQLWARFAGTAPVRISARGRDAQGRWAAVGRDGGASVVFTEFQPGALILRIAWHRAGWHVASLARLRQTVPTARTVVSPDGDDVFVAWIESVGSQQRLRVASLTGQGGWRIQTLEDAQGLGPLVLRAFPGGTCTVAWKDVIAGQSRVRAAEFVDGAWQAPATLGTSLDGVDTLSLSGATPDASFRLWADGRARTARAQYQDERWRIEAS